MNYELRKKQLIERHEALLAMKNEPEEWGNGIYERYQCPILTAEHTPLEWRYDFSEKDNPYLMQRIMMNAVLNAGAIKLNGRYLLVCRVEGADRKSFFAVAESPNGIDNFRFWDDPITMPEDLIPATNVYDMRLTQHEDGWIYGVFCAERHDDSQPGNLSAATATAAIARMKDLKDWERLPDLKSRSQQRNVVLHPEFVDGKYAFYTRPQDGFIDTGSGGGIGWTLVEDITLTHFISHRTLDLSRNVNETVVCTDHDNVIVFQTDITSQFAIKDIIIHVDHRQLATTTINLNITKCTNTCDTTCHIYCMEHSRKCRERISTWGRHLTHHIDHDGAGLPYSHLDA